MFVLATTASFFATQLFLYTVVVWIASAGNRSLSALFYGLAFLPFLLFSRNIGRLTDRVNRLRVVCIAHLMIAALFGATLLLRDDSSQLRMVSIGACFGALFIFIPSFRYALIADLYPKDMQPARLVSLNIISVLSLSCSPLLHLLLISFGPEGPLLASVLLMGFATICYLLLYLRRQQPLPVHPAVTSVRILEYTGTQTGAVFFCILGIAIIGPLQSLVPGFLAAITHSESTRDLLMPAIGVGLIASSPLLKLARRFDRVYTSILLTVVLAAVACLLANAHSTFIAALTLFAIGASAGILVNWNQSVIQAATPHHAQGQLMSFLAALNMGVPALFSLLVGGLNTLMPTHHALLAVPFFLLLALSLFSARVLFYSTLSRIEERK